MIYLLLLLKRELSIVFMKVQEELMKHIIIQLIIMIIQKDIKNMLIIRQEKINQIKNFIKELKIHIIVKINQNQIQNINHKKLSLPHLESWEYH